MKNGKHTKWVAGWGTATSITDRKESVYAKDITLRYPVRCCFDGSAIRLHFSNLTGTEEVRLTRVFVGRVPVTFGSSAMGVIPAGEEIVSDEIEYEVSAGDTLQISIYLGDYTQMNAGTLVTGPLSKGKYSYGDFALAEELPADLTRSTNWYYFLNTADVLTSEDKRAVICYGDSITAQSWPDYLALELGTASGISVIRRAVCGTRILRQYDCITYQAYGLKGSVRFPVETEVAGATDVIIQHGINDIIHPVGVEVNPFRPWSDMPSLEDLTSGVEEIYVKHARAKGLRVWSGTLLPIEGWRTYSLEREDLRLAFNEWLRTSPVFNGCIDFDKAVRNPSHPSAFAPGFDSGDHLHPSDPAYQAMAQAAFSALVG